MPRIVFLSDTHGFYDRIEVPDGDILIHSGDFGAYGQLSELKEFHDWMAEHPHRHKVFVAGNHDWCFEKEPKESQKLMTDVIYLQDSSVTLMGLKFYGSPWQPRFHDWAFNVNRGRALAKIWDKIPKDTDVVVTHGPPFKILDRTEAGLNVGCEDLLSRVEKIKPRLHCFGHIHEGYGRQTTGESLFVNGSICDANYDPRNAPISIDIPKNRT